MKKILRGNFFFFIFIDRKRKIKEDIVIVKKTKTLKLNVYLNQAHSRFLKTFRSHTDLKNWMI